MPFSIGWHPAFLTHRIQDILLPQNQPEISQFVLTTIAAQSPEASEQVRKALQQVKVICVRGEANDKPVREAKALENDSGLQIKLGDREILKMSWSPQAQALALWSPDLQRFISLETWWGLPLAERAAIPTDSLAQAQASPFFTQLAPGESRSFEWRLSSSHL